MDYSDEEWKPVVGYEGFYEVSSSGRVRRVASNPARYRGIIKKPCDNGFGYKSCWLKKNGEKSFPYIHQIVAEAFIGPRPPGMEVNHIDHNRANNSASNLEYVDRQGNVDHAMRHGRFRLGEELPWAKLTVKQVLEIRADGATMKRRDIAKKYDISLRQVFRILSKELWAHID